MAIIIFFHFFVATSSATLCMFLSQLIEKSNIFSSLENFFKDFVFLDQYSINQTLIEILVLKIQADNVHRTLYVSCQ